MVQQKVDGKAVTIIAPTPAGAPIIDLMEALKASLARRGGRDAGRPVAPAERGRAARRRPPAAVRSGPASGPPRRTGARR